MEIRESLEILLKNAGENLKSGIDEIRYDIAKKGLTKTPPGSESYLDQAIVLLQNEIFKVLNEIKNEIFKPKEWDYVRTVTSQYLEDQCNAFRDFLVNNWGQPDAQISSQLNVLRSNLLKESNFFIDRQKIKLSKGEQTTKDLVKILYYGLAAGIVGFLLKLIVSR